MKNKDLLQFLDDSHADSMKGGEADKKAKKPSDFPVKALLKGMAVELEHSEEVGKAMEVAMDHLSESESYYDALEKVEKKAKESDEEEEEKSDELGPELDDFGIPKDA